MLRLRTFGGLSIENAVSGGAMPNRRPTQYSSRLANNGYRPVVKSVLARNRKKFPVRPGEFTIAAPYLGGWKKVQKRFFDPKTGIMVDIERKIGGDTG